MNQLQETLLEILKDTVSVIEKNNLRYSLDFGTALGAVRHSGFIPWDDDVDISMPRDDYEKFLEISQKELGDKYFVQTLETDKNAFWPYAKIRKNDTLYVEAALRHAKLNQGIFIDIFPLDYVTYDKKAIENCRKVNNQLFYWGTKDLVRMPQKTVKYIVRNFLKNLQHYLRRLLPKSYYMKKYKQSIEGLKKDVTKDKMFYNFFSNDYYFDVDRIFPTKKIRFEDQEFEIYNDCDYVLKKFYGDDYMTLPPEDKRIQHSVMELKL